jgi:hypothetical protein
MDAKFRGSEIPRTGYAESALASPRKISDIRDLADTVLGDCLPSKQPFRVL